jgi:iron(III) transport system substrate-binding protein
VGIAPNNPSFVDFVTVLRGIVGDERTSAFLERLAANGARPYANNDAVLAAVARDEVEFGLVNHYYNERAKQDDPEQPTENHLFEAGDPGTLILVSTAGILTTGEDHRAAAERFVRFLLSRESQVYFSTETLEYPLASGVEPAIDDLPPLDDIAAPDVDLSALGEAFTTTRDLIEASGLADG